MSQARLEPVSDEMRRLSDAGRDATIAMMRDKVAKAFNQEEPAAVAEIAELAVEKTPSKHQLFMKQLAASGKSLAEIQTDWHHYYTLLPDREKREVWREFYSANQNTRYEELFKKSQASTTQGSVVFPGASQAMSVARPNGVFTSNHQPEPEPAPRKSYQPLPPRSYKPLLTSNPKSKAGKQAQKIANEIHRKVSAGGQLKLKHHLQSLAFGLGTGALVLLVILFGFFNEYFIAPFIQPSRSVTDTPIIMTSNIAGSAKPTIIVPKINVQVPVDFEISSTDEKTVQTSLKEGVVHYPSTVRPGENGNGAYFGHSSQNILNSGKFKYAFILLHEMTTGDIFYITYQGKVYAYQVFAKEVVPPSQVGVINDTKGKQSTVTLITCDPPGISTNRLIVWGEQISPSVSSNTVPAETPSETPSAISSDGPKMWSKFVRALQFWKHDNTAAGQ